MDFILINKAVFVINKIHCIIVNDKTQNKEVYKQPSILY